MSDVTVRVDKRKLEKLEKEFPGIVDKILGGLAFDGQRYIQENFSDQSPSSPGDPPGIVTGKLKNSIYTEKIQAMLWRITAGTEYAAYLEYGTQIMPARPFMMPAAEYIIGQMPGAFDGALKDYE